MLCVVIVCVYLNTKLSEVVSEIYNMVFWLIVYEENCNIGLFSYDTCSLLC